MEFKPVICTSTFRDSEGRVIFEKYYEYEADTETNIGEVTLRFYDTGTVYHLTKTTFLMYFEYLEESILMVLRNGPTPDHFLLGKSEPSTKPNALAPSHYKHGDTYEVIKVIEAWGLDKDAYLFNVIKYVARAGKKHPEKYLEDLKKAQYYLNRRIEQCQQQK